MKYIIIIILMMGIFASTPVVAMSAAIHVPEKYTEVRAGERFYFDVEIKYPENPARKDLRINYEVSKNKEIIAQAKVLKAVETQASFIDFIVLPERAKPGVYIITVKIADYENLNEEVAASFEVINDTSSELKMYFFILLGAIAIVGLLICASIFFNKNRPPTQPIKDVSSVQPMKEV